MAYGYSFAFSGSNRRKSSGGPAPIPSWQIIGFYNDVGFGLQGSNAASTNVVSRKFDVPNIDITAFRSLEQTFFIGGSAGGVDTSIVNAINVRHRMWLASSNIAESPAPISVPANDGGYQVLEFVGNIPAGSKIYLDRESAVPTSGQNTGPQTLIYSSQGAHSEVGRKSGNNTLVFDISGLTVGSGSIHSPITIGYGVHLFPTYVFVGDSIISSNGELYDGDGGPVGEDGRDKQGGAWARRTRHLAQALAGRTVPMRLMGRPSAQMTGMRSSSGAGGAKRRESYKYCNTLVIQMGINDLGASRTAAQLKADIEAEIAAYRAIWSAANPFLPCYVIVCTVTPRGASSYNTPIGFASEIIQHNYNVRHGLIVGSDGYWDPNLAVADSSNESIWADASYCGVSDWTHPVPLGYSRIAMEVSPYMAMSSNHWRNFLSV